MTQFLKCFLSDKWKKITQEQLKTVIDEIIILELINGGYILKS